MKSTRTSGGIESLGGAHNAVGGHALPVVPRERFARTGHDDRLHHARIEGIGICREIEEGMRLGHIFEQSDAPGHDRRGKTGPVHI